jgi:hypothetical protein
MLIPQLDVIRDFSFAFNFDDVHIWLSVVGDRLSVLGPSCLIFFSLDKPA